MSARVPILICLLAFGVLSGPVGADEEAPSDGIAWHKDLPKAFDQAHAENRVLMICVNAKHVRGRKTEEPAAKGLREVVYKDPRIIERSKAFLCVLLTREGTAEDYGELRALGIDGDLVSPQHIFVHPEGKPILVRQEYWPWGKDETAVQKLLSMMDEAERKWKGGGAGGDGADEDGPPEDAAERAAWIQEKLGLVVNGGPDQKASAVRVLVKHDREGDCINLLLPLFDEHKKNVGVLVPLIRGLGQDGLLQAAPPIAKLLGHKAEEVRGNAAVSLEYIGSADKKVIAALKKAAGKEKVEAIANHAYRALGRCGAMDAKVRQLLLKKTGGAKSEFASYGPAIGLAYFVDDDKARRGVEKLLKAIGVPGGGRRGGGGNTVKRGVLSWTLAAIGDEKSAAFVREELLAKLENMQAFWVAGLRMFYEGVAAACESKEKDLSGVEAGVRRFRQIAKDWGLGRYSAEIRGLYDAYRADRDNAKFTPKGDKLLGTADEG